MRVGQGQDTTTGTILRDTACNAVVNLFVLASHSELHVLSRYQEFEGNVCMCVLLPTSPEGRGEVIRRQAG